MKRKLHFVIDNKLSIVHNKNDLTVLNPRDMKHLKQLSAPLFVISPSYITRNPNAINESIHFTKCIEIIFYLI